MRLAVIALAAGISCLGAAALAARISPFTTPAPPSGAGLSHAECFQTSEIRNRVIADDRTLLLNVEGKTYRLTMRDRCLANASSNTDPISLSKPPGRNWICKPTDINLAVSKGGSVRPCFIDSIARMAPAEVATLPKKFQP